MTDDEWSTHFVRSMGLFLSGRTMDVRDEHGRLIEDDSFLLLFNAHYEEIAFRLPARRFGTRWELELATGTIDAERLMPGLDVTVEARSLVVLPRSSHYLTLSSPCLVFQLSDDAL